MEQTLKVFLNGREEVRKFRFNFQEGYVHLEHKIRAIFRLLDTQDVRIHWKDQEGDNIRLSSDADLQVMLSDPQCNIIKPGGGYPDRKLYVSVEGASKPTSAPESSSSVAHPHVTCDGCGMKPLQGNRFKCLKCANFDLCDQCFRQGRHSEHPMMVMRTSEEALFGLVSESALLEQLLEGTGCPWMRSQSEHHQQPPTGVDPFTPSEQPNAPAESPVPSSGMPTVPQPQPHPQVQPEVQPQPQVQPPLQPQPQVQPPLQPQPQVQPPLQPQSQFQPELQPQPQVQPPMQPQPQVQPPVQPQPQVQPQFQPQMQPTEIPASAAPQQPREYLPGSGWTPSFTAGAPFPVYPNLFRGVYPIQPPAPPAPPVPMQHVPPPAPPMPMPHLPPHVANNRGMMLQMGFNDDNGALTASLLRHNGDISKCIDDLQHQPQHRHFA